MRLDENEVRKRDGGITSRLATAYAGRIHGGWRSKERDRVVMVGHYDAIG